MYPDADYQELDRKLKRAHILGTVQGLLGWDEQANLPADSADQRQEQSAAMSTLVHQASVDPEIGRLLARLEARADALEPDPRVVIREARRNYDRAVKLPAEFVERGARLDSEAYHAWAKARAESRFSIFAPYLRRQLEHARERARHLGWEDRPYDLQIDLHDPGMDAATISPLFDELQAGLAPIARAILDSEIKPPESIFKDFPVEQQRAFLEKVIASLGFNYKRGRIDVSLHPFCSGNGADIRMTTRFDPDNPLDSLFSSIHETGHGLYEQGLPLASLHNALGQAAGMGVHESQSRLWENQVCRSRAFWTFYEPRLRDAFPKQLEQVSSEQLYLAINAVGNTPIRVDADEVTYNLHIVIRFEIEQRLFSGELSVDDLPAYWNSRYKALLGIEPRNDAEGALQDVHWSGGAFGYFPSYTLGNLLAAQLWYAALDGLPDLERDFERGDFSRLLGWLRTNVHAHGARYRLPELAERATGQRLSPQAFLRYLSDRYLRLYEAS